MERAPLPWSVDIGTMIDPYDEDMPCLFIEFIDHPVRSTTR